MIESYSVSGRSRRLPTALGRPAIFEERKERYHDNIPILYHCDHCGLSGRHGAGGGLLQPEGRGSSSHEFYLGGRKLGPIVTAMSAEASDMSSYLLMGLPGLAYLCGVAEVGWTAIGLAIGTYLNWLIVAKRLRRYSAKIGAITIPGFFPSGSGTGAACSPASPRW